MLAGRLRGMGREAECTLSAEKVSLPGTNMYEYAKLTILGEPKDLPDGQYEVTYDGRTQKVQRKFGAWIAPI
jgi:hypothetical protein